MDSHNLTPLGYLPRIADEQIDRYLKIFGAVEIAGTKWCGKTWSALAHGKSVSYVDDNFALAKADPAIMTKGEAPHVIDEWQLVPSIWDAVRRRADESRNLRGGWILTGSSTPFGEKDDAPRHSGAGRIGRIRMYPMTLQESGDSEASVSLRGLFQGTFEPAQISLEAKDAAALVELTCRGGWPEAINLSSKEAQVIAREYLRVLFSETPKKHRLDGGSLSRLVSSLSRTVGQSATQKVLFRDMSGIPVEQLSSTHKALLSRYLQFLKSIYLLEEIPGWVPPHRSPKRLSIKPKRYLADPSLAIAQLGLGAGSLLTDWQTYGMMFENLCIRDLLVYASALEDIGYEPVRYYRDDSGLEVDAIIELSDGRWAAIECKLSEDKVPEGVANLKRLREKLCSNPKAKVRPPEFMAVLVGLSAYAREAEEGIYVIPIRALGA
ncbi:MAG: ATP-binding protein [Eggerthellaceae bacterium]|nr:ATP-binding protein [Eggerthellaceae bacterium]